MIVVEIQIEARYPPAIKQQQLELEARDPLQKKAAKVHTSKLNGLCFRF